MRNINYKSDFPLFQSIYMTRLNKETGKWEKVDIGFPEYDFKLYYYTASRNNPFVAHCKYDREGKPQCVNCMKTDDGRLLVLFNNHGLNCGDLKVEIDMEIPNKIFQDGFQKEVIPGPTGTSLWDRPTEGYGPAEAEVLLPFIKGEPFKFEDFTPEQLSELTKAAAQKVLDEADEEIRERMDEIKKNIEKEIQEDLVTGEEYTEEDLLKVLLCDDLEDEQDTDP